MKVENNEIYMTEEEFNALQDFKIDSNINNNEGILKHIEIGGENQIIKKHKRERERTHYNLNMFLKYRDCLTQYIPELVLPEKKVIIMRDFGPAYTMKIINGVPLEWVLRDSRIKMKIQLLQIINKFGQIPNFPYNLYIGDLHEGNILITTNKNLKIIDTLSTYIENMDGLIFEIPNEAPHSKYLEYNKEIKKTKYAKKYRKGYPNVIIPSKDTDIFCYIIIILNTLAQIEASMITLDALLNYLDYLENIGIDINFLNSVKTLFTTSPNINPYEYISNITNEQLEEAHYLTYKKRTNIDLTTCI